MLVLSALAGALLATAQGPSPVLPSVPDDPDAPPVTSSTFTAPAPGLLQVTAAASDARGNLYLTGRTSVRGLPDARTAFQGTASGQDAFVIALDPTGRVLWASYLGGNDWRSGSRHFPGDIGLAIAVDPQGQPVVAGQTCSTDFPTTSAVLPSAVAAAACDGFVTKFGADGRRLLFSTYLGGVDAPASVTGLAAGPAGETWLALTSISRRIATHADLSGGDGTLVVVKLNPAGGVTWSTRLRRHPWRPGSGPVPMAVDAAGDVYLAADAPDGGALVTRLDGSGRRLVYEVPLRRDAEVSALTVAGDGHLVVTGRTLGALDTLNAWQAAPGGGWDGFFARITPGGALSSLSYLGGPNWEASGSAVHAVATAGGVLVGLAAGSQELPVFRPWMRRHPDGTLRSTDLGGSWSYVQPGASALVGDGVHQAIFGVRSDVVVSEDNGDTWRVESPRAPAGVEPITASIVAVDPRGPRYMTSRYIVWRYLPGAQTATEILRAQPGAVLNVLAVNPLDGSAWVSGNHGLEATWDGGTTWLSRREGLPGGVDISGTFRHSSPEALAFDPFRPEIAYAGMRDGLYASTDAGASWRNVTSQVDAVLGGPAHITAVVVDPRDPRTVYAGTFGRGVIVSNDRGATWSVALREVGITALAVDPVDSRVYASLALGEGEPLIWHSRDRGLTWQPSSKPWQLRRQPGRLFVHPASRRVFAESGYSDSAPYLALMRTAARPSDRALTAGWRWLASAAHDEPAAFGPVFASYLGSGSLAALAAAPDGDVAAVVVRRDGFSSSPAEFTVLRFRP